MLIAFGSSWDIRVVVPNRVDLDLGHVFNIGSGNFCTAHPYMRSTVITNSTNNIMMVTWRNGSSSTSSTRMTTYCKTLLSDPVNHFMGVSNCGLLLMELLASPAPSTPVTPSARLKALIMANSPCICRLLGTRRHITATRWARS